MAHYSNLFRTQRVAKHAVNKTRDSFSSNAALNLVRRFDPLASFDWHSLASIARHARELRMPADRVLVRPPRHLPGVWYLHTGTLVDELTGRRFVGGSAQCRLPVYPGNLSLRSCTPVRLVYFNNDYLSLLLPKPSSVLAATEAPTPAEGWLDVLAESPLLHLLYQRRGAAGWQSWLRGLESLAVDRGDTIIERGTRGHYFYIVQAGTAVVTHEQELARVDVGGFFGEDALLSGQCRNASVTMPDGGRILRGTAGQLCGLVDDLWWALARNPNSWRRDNQLLTLRNELPTRSLRNWLSSLPSEVRYGLTVGSDLLLQDLLLLLLVHRGYAVVLREQVADVTPEPCARAPTL